MQDIHIFENVEDAVGILKNYKKTIDKKDLAKEAIIKSSIQSNIVRGFHKLNRPPSSIYREWANKNIDEIIAVLNSITAKEDFDAHLFEWIDDFIDYWNSQINDSNKRIIFGQASKIVNVLIKTLNESTFLSNENVVPFLNVPFDEFSLKPIKNVINKLTEVKYRINIPTNPTMSYINSPDLYRIIQNAVFELCKKASIVPILYDYWCWNEKHDI